MARNRGQSLRDRVTRLRVKSTSASGRSTGRTARARAGAQAAGDGYRSRTESIVLHRRKLLACSGPNAASWWAELNRPTAGAGWLTCEPSGRKPRAISFNPQPTARNLTKPARMLCMGPKRVFASTGREHAGEQPIDRQNCATVALARSCFESVGLAFHAARYLFLNRFHQATVTPRRDHCRSSLDQNSNQSKA